MLESQDLKQQQTSLGARMGGEHYYRIIRIRQYQLESVPQLPIIFRTSILSQTLAMSSYLVTSYIFVTLTVRPRSWKCTHYIRLNVYKMEIHWSHLERGGLAEPTEKRAWLSVCGLIQIIFCNFLYLYLYNAVQSIIIKKRYFLPMSTVVWNQQDKQLNMVESKAHIRLIVLWIHFLLQPLFSFLSL